MKRTEISLQFTNKDEKLFGVLHLPKAKGKFPCVVMFHGFTGHKAEAHFLFTKMARKFAEAGIAAFRFDFRGSGDSEGKFENMTIGTEISDGRAAVEFIKKHANINKDKIGLLGLSMGGFVAAYLSSVIPGVKSVVLWSAVAEYRKVLSKILKIDLRSKKRLNPIDLGGMTVGRKFYKAILLYDGLNLTSINEYENPLLIVHSDNDGAVPFSDSSLYYKVAGSCVKEVKKIKGGGHTYEHADIEPKVIEYTARWTKKNLR